MSGAEIAVTVCGFVLMAFVAWYFWFAPRRVMRVAPAAGMQEASIVVKGGYSPDVIVVQAGKPVRLHFTRRETAACTEQVVFPDFGKSAFLPPDQTVTIEFTPERPGEYEFLCGMRMLRGKIIAQ